MKRDGHGDIAVPILYSIVSKKRRKKNAAEHMVPRGVERKESQFLFSPMLESIAI